MLAAWLTWRYEHVRAGRYADKMQAVALASAERLDEVFLELQKITSLLAHLPATAAPCRAPPIETLTQVATLMRDHGVVAAVSMCHDAFAMAPPSSRIGDVRGLITSSRAHCPQTPGALCISHGATGTGGRWIVVSSPHADPQVHVGALVALVVDWQQVGTRLVAETRLDENTRAYVLDDDGSVLAWSGKDSERHLLAGPNGALLKAESSVKVGTGVLRVGLVAPRRAAYAGVGSLVVTGGTLFGLIVVSLGVILLWSHRVGVAQLRASEDISARTLRLNERLEATVAARTAELERVHERALLAAREQGALARLALVGELAASFAHEVRTPLNALSIANQRLSRALKRDEALPPDKAIELLASQSRDIEVINQYVERDLGLSRRTRHERTSVEVETLVQEVFGYLEHEATRRGVMLVQEPIADAGAIVLDGGKLRVVLVNLILNAIQAQPQGGEVRVHATNVGTQLTVVVRDRGPGISESQAATLFRPFVSYREGGVGLGLAICQRLAEEEGARIAHRPRDGGGTEFAVTWPVETNGGH